MAREYNIDLAQVKGTGAGGRITKQDVEAYMSSQAARTYSAPAAPAAQQPAPRSRRPQPLPRLLLRSPWPNRRRFEPSP